MTPRRPATTTTAITLLLGGLIGGFVMGLYWTITSTLFNMHTGDAFGALGIKDYKHFLRIRLEPDRAQLAALELRLREGRLRPLVGTTYALDDAPAADPAAPARDRAPPGSPAPP